MKYRIVEHTTTYADGHTEKTYSVEERHRCGWFTAYIGYDPFASPLEGLTRELAEKWIQKLRREAVVSKTTRVVGDEECS